MRAVSPYRLKPNRVNPVDPEKNVRPQMVNLSEVRMVMLNSGLPPNQTKSNLPEGKNRRKKRVYDEQFES